MFCRKILAALIGSYKLYGHTKAGTYFLCVNLLCANKYMLLYIAIVGCRYMLYVSQTTSLYDYVQALCMCPNQTYDINFPFAYATFQCMNLIDQYVLS